jgi:predicted DNA-binding transcriptional regulator YafY
MKRGKGGAPRNRGLIRQWKLVRSLMAARLGLTFAQLIEAAEEPVTMRTIRRDVDTLTLAGFPVDVVTQWPHTKVYWRHWSTKEAQPAASWSRSMH